MPTPMLEHQIRLAALAKARALQGQRQVAKIQSQTQRALAESLDLIAKADAILAAPIAKSTPSGSH